MFAIFKQLLLARQIQFEEGKIILFNQRITMIPIYTFVTLQHELEKIDAVNHIYETMKLLGKQWTIDLQKKYSTKHKDVVKWGINIVTLAGWGRVEAIKDDVSSKKAVFRLHESAIAEKYSELYGKSKDPVDHIFRGMIAGTFSILYNSDIDCNEVKCKVMGNPYCEFLVGRGKS